MDKVLNHIKNRRSPVIFSDKSVNDDIIADLFRAAGRAPSGFNRQPWRFLLTRKGESAYDLLLGTLNETNAGWAGKAPLLVLVLSVKETKERGINAYSGYEAGMAVGNLLVQAEYSGLIVHQMGGYNKEEARRIFEIPAEMDLLTVMAIGYHGDPATANEEIRLRDERVTPRHDLDTILWNEKVPS